MEYTVKKNKKNRIALRLTASAFFLIAVIRLIIVMNSEGSTNIFLTIVLCTGGFGYGIYLLCATMKPQAYDITYQFRDKTIVIKMHKKNKEISYSEILDLGYISPNPNIDYGIIQMYVGTEQYVIPFMNNSNVGKALYEMLKLKKEEVEEGEAK